MANGELPDLEEFCLKVPLYKKYKLYQYRFETIKSYHTDDITRIDCYCIDCKRNATFVSNPTPTYTSYINGSTIREPDCDFFIRDHNLVRIYKCTRNPKHTKIEFYICIKDKMIFKIGQHPSMADLSKPEIQKYTKILGDDLFEEFNCAIGLVSHGVGIGAFVYLRRIFEKQIEQAHEEAKRSETWDEKKYQQKRISEKIKLLKGSLPQSLVKNTKLHSILSKGIHELDEQECLDAFPVVKLGIEMILDEKIRIKELEEKDKQVDVEVGKLHEKLKGKDEGK